MYKSVDGYFNSFSICSLPLLIHNLSYLNFGKGGVSGGVSSSVLRCLTINN